MEVAAAADVGMIQHGRALLRLRRAIEIVLEMAAMLLKVSGPIASARAATARAGSRPRSQAQHAEAGTESLFGMRPVGEHGDDPALGIWANRAPPALEAGRSSLGITRCVLGMCSGSVP
ncbi:hypothetical protein EAS62_37200 [Bradyrhizobium zhanjiangense]|uniref:Uncharacterized protein n=1 Tax=Bradyrhizobium zhanjiangense TaxID=1325107 RepID=A0ABY0D9I3_9BRAD|nr:hypothetical protein EAS62_37200 [Bradyrhizobium zhanjiangense]